jgi:hypothetical protein
MVGETDRDDIAVGIFRWVVIPTLVGLIATFVVWLLH